MLELLGQMLETLQAHGLSQQPLLEGLLGQLQTLPRVRDVRHGLALGGQIGGTIRETQLGLQRVEVRLQLGLLLDAWRLVLAPVGAVLLQLLLHSGQRVVSLARVQPRHRAADPLQQLGEKQKRIIMGFKGGLSLDLHHWPDARTPP